MPTWVYRYHMHAGASRGCHRGYRISWVWSSRQLWAACHECWELNLDPLQEQLVLLTSEPSSLQAQETFLKDRRRCKAFLLPTALTLVSCSLWWLRLSSVQKPGATLLHILTPHRSSDRRRPVTYTWLTCILLLGHIDHVISTWLPHKRCTISGYIDILLRKHQAYNLCLLLVYVVGSFIWHG